METAKKYLWLPGRPLPQLEAHSEAKHQIFRAYLNAYINRLTRRPEQDRLRLTIVDGFCGGGIYSDSDGNEVPGSPMILLQEVAAAQAAVRLERHKPFDLSVDFYFVDAQLSHCVMLQEQINNSSFAPMLNNTIKIIHGSFADVYERIEKDICARAGKRRSLFFLDQYGYSDAPLALLNRIMSTISGAEVILTFAIDALINYLSDTDRFASAVAPVGLSRTDIAALKRLWDLDESSGRYVVQNALFRHIRRVTGAPYSSPFFVKSRVSKRAYWLVHLSKHHTARDVMGEIHWEVQNSSLHYGTDGLISLGFDAAHQAPALPFSFGTDARNRSMKRIASEAPRLIFQADADGGPIRFEDFLSRLCSDTPVTRSMLVKCIVDMQAAGEIEVKTEDNVPRRGIRIDWNDRIGRPSEPKLFSVWNPVTRPE